MRTLELGAMTRLEPNTRSLSLNELRVGMLGGGWAQAPKARHYETLRLAGPHSAAHAVGFPRKTAHAQ